MKKLIILITVIFLFSCDKNVEGPSDYLSESLRIEKISPNIFKHVSYLDTEDFGKVACNGMIYFYDKNAIIFDTPTTNEVSKELIDWVQDDLKFEVQAVVVSHFHTDCLGGLKAFHENNIESYANNLTIQLAEKDSLEQPKNGFASTLKLKINDKKVINTFFGKGHTYDNIVSYIPAESVLFGGCLIKSMNATKGNLSDADTLSWLSTVEKIKQTYPKLKFVIPGHGNEGGIELLDYTVDLFKRE